MLRVNVGLSRKLTRDFNSTGFSINVEGEVVVPLDDPEKVIEKIREFYDLAEESLSDQIEQYESDSAIASHDAPVAAVPSAPPVRTQPFNRIATTPTPAPAPAPVPPPQPVVTQAVATPTNGEGASDPPATNKQVQFLLSLGKRGGLTTPQLEARVEGILGRKVGLYQLTKREAGYVLDQMTAETPARN